MNPTQQKNSEENFCFSLKKCSIDKEDSPSMHEIIWSFVGLLYFIVQYPAYQTVHERSGNELVQRSDEILREIVVEIPHSQTSNALACQEQGLRAYSRRTECFDFKSFWLQCNISATPIGQMGLEIVGQWGVFNRCGRVVTDFLPYPKFSKSLPS